MKKLLLLFGFVSIIGWLMMQSALQSSLLHKTEATLDGLHFIQLRASEVWSRVPLPNTQADVTVAAFSAGLFPRDWQGMQHPFGGRVLIGRGKAGEPIAGKASLLVTLFAVPQEACPSLMKAWNAQKLLKIWVNNKESEVCLQEAMDIRLALTVQAPLKQGK